MPINIARFKLIGFSIQLLLLYTKINTRYKNVYRVLVNEDEYLCYSTRYPSWYCNTLWIKTSFKRKRSGNLNRSNLLDWSMIGNQASFPIKYDKFDNSAIYLNYTSVAKILTHKILYVNAELLLYNMLIQQFAISSFTWYQAIKDMSLETERGNRAFLPNRSMIRLLLSLLHI